MMDDRGQSYRICTIRHATRVSGYAKGYLVRSDETGRFWVVFWVFGLSFAILMHLNAYLTSTLFGVKSGMAINTLAGQIQFGAQLLLFGGMMGGLNKLYLWRTPEDARRAMLRAGLCVSCAYQLDGCQAEPDGCTVCPECGAAWRIAHNQPGSRD